MSEMVERVSTAIWRQLRAPNYTPQDVGRAAIEAMRKPTEAMVGIGCVFDPLDGSRDINREVWMAMIEAALQ